MQQVGPGQNPSSNFTSTQFLMRISFYFLAGIEITTFP